MASNRGNTSLKCKRRNEKPMLEFDRLPRELRVLISIQTNEVLFE